MKTFLFKNFVLVISLFLLLSINSCTVLRTHTAKSTDILDLGVIQKPLVVDLAVKETKVTGTATTSYSGEKIESITNNAIFDALQNSKADLLVEPRVDTETNGDKTTVVVTGYPANYKNFRPAVLSDTTYLKLGLSRTVKSYEPTIETKKKGGAATIGGIAGGVVLLLLLLSGI